MVISYVYRYISQCALLIPMKFASSSQTFSVSAFGSAGGVYVVNSTSTFLNLLKFIAPLGWKQEAFVPNPKL